MPARTASKPSPMDFQETAYLIDMLLGESSIYSYWNMTVQNLTPIRAKHETPAPVPLPRPLSLPSNT